jgi:hypothetical protein
MNRDWRFALHKEDQLERVRLIRTGQVWLCRGVVPGWANLIVVPVHLLSYKQKKPTDTFTRSHDHDFQQRVN